jgi:hypothetical protein
MNVSCLVNAGVLSQAQADEFGKIIAQLPSGTSELLKMLNAQLLSQENDPIILGVETLTKNNVTVGVLTPPAGATKAILSVYTNAIMYRLDANNPAGPATGHHLAALATLEINELEGFRFVAFDNSASATIFVTYY